MQRIDGGLERVPGYRFSSVPCGIRYENRTDYTLLVSGHPCHAAGMFTRNRAAAAPVQLCHERIHGEIRAILVNSTNANACTGEKGYENALRLTSDLAEKLDIAPESVLMSSTGVIGQQLPVEKMLQCHTALIDSLSSDRGLDFTRAIMTTDTVPKYSAATFSARGSTWHIAGTAKGSGMIAPDMATMLAYCITDAPVPPESLEKLFRRHVGRTLNALSIDGDTSTNDSAIILAPVAQEPLREEDLADFEEALAAILEDLSEALVRDAEGATTLIKIQVTGAASDSDAEEACRAVANSLLVKTAFFGRDPNWGRIAMALGNASVPLDISKTDISIAGHGLLESGNPLPFNEDIVRKAMDADTVTVDIALNLGSGTFSMLTCDISYEYVKINAEYTT